MKRGLSLIVSAILCISILAGCTGKNASQASTSSQATASGSEVQTEKKIKLTYCSWMTKGEDKVTNENFMSANKNIEVETVALDGTQYDTLLRTKVLAGNAPDVFIATAAQRDAFVTDNYLMEIKDIPAIENLLAKFELLDKNSRTNGKLYGFPMSPNADIDQVYYNKNYFKEKGFKVPATMEEFEKLLAEIKADGKEPIVVGGKDAWTSNAFAKSFTKAINLSQYDGIEFDRKLLAGEVKMSDYYKEAFENWEGYVKKGYVSPASVSLTYDQSVQYFADGKAALLAQGSWIAGVENVTGAKNMDLGAFLMPVPQVDGKRYIAASASTFLVVSSKTADPDAAMKLLEYWTTPEVLKEYGDRTGSPSLYPVDYKISPVLEDVEKSKAAADVVMDFGGQLSKIPQGVYDETQTSMVNIIAGSTAKDELERIDALFEKTKSIMKID